MANVLVTAFQIGAFQFTGFQEAGGVSGGGDIPWFWFEMIARARAKRAIADEKKRKRKEEEQEESEPAFATMRFVLVEPRAPQPTAFLKRLLPVGKPLIDEATELAEFKRLMAFVQSLPARLEKLSRGYRTVEIAQPAHERPTLIALQDRMAPAIARFFVAQVPKIAHQIEQLKARFWKADLSDDEMDALDAIIAGIDFTGWAVLSGDVDPLLAEAMKDGSHEALKAVGFDTTADPAVFNTVNQDALAYASDRSAEMVGMVRTASGRLTINPNAEYAITESTRDDIKTLVGQALDEGWSTDRLAQALIDSNTFSMDRAQTIARTEIIRASNQGTLNGFKASGVVEMVEWTTFDPCPICEANEEAGPIPLGDEFPSGDDAPPAHPNCKCALVGLTALDTTEPQTTEE